MKDDAKNSKDIFGKEKDEKLVENLQKNFDNNSKDFKDLFKRCSKKLYIFLIKKGYSKFDSEDILQNYFSSYGEDGSYSNFEKAIMSFDNSYGKKFINYVKKIILLRLISRNYKKEKEKNVVVGSLNQKIGDNEQTERMDLVGKDYYDLNDIFLEDVRKIVIAHIYSIENENHRTAVVCRLCLPFKMTVSEISEVLEVNERTLSTYIYRGVDRLTKMIKADQRLKNLSYEETTKKFIDKRLLHIKRETIKETMEEGKEYEIFEKLLYSRKSIEEISEELCIDILEIKKTIKNGITKLVSNKDFLLK